MLKILSLGLLIFSISVGAKDIDVVKQNIIDASIASYPGSCPCPYSIMKNGRKCGRRSAYSKPGGFSPICYKKDVTPQMIKNQIN